MILKKLIAKVLWSAFKHFKNATSSLNINNQGLCQRKTMLVINCLCSVAINDTVLIDQFYSH